MGKRRVPEKREVSVATYERFHFVGLGAGNRKQWAERGKGMALPGSAGRAEWVLSWRQASGVEAGSLSY